MKLTKRGAYSAIIAAGSLIIMLVEFAPPPPSPGASATAAAPSGFALDSLDILPSQAGDLRIKAAWRINASGIAENSGVYGWSDGTSAEATIMCVTPPRDDVDCDISTPKRVTLGRHKACGFTGYDRDTGPFIMWPGCEIRLPPTPRIKGAFERLRLAAADAAEWSDRYRSAVSGGDRSGFAINREYGLLAASRVGNTQVPSLSHQLDR